MTTPLFKRNSQLLQEDKDKQEIMRKYWRKNDPSWQVLCLKFIELPIEEFEMICQLTDGQWDLYEMLRYEGLKRTEYNKQKKEGLDIPFYLYRLMKEIDEKFDREYERED